MSTLIGHRLANRYDIQSFVGQGGMGVVYRGYDSMLQRAVAVKVLPLQMTIDPVFVQRFRQEAVVAASLRHPGIVTIYDVGVHPGERPELNTYYIVMEYLEGVTLDKWLADTGSLALDRISDMVRQIGEALDYAHSRGVVHRDIKPSNIMVGANGQITLMDFGLGRAGEGSGLTHTGMIVGTPDYMAPEQALGHPVDSRTDIYSFGVVIYRALSGQVPFARSTPLAIAYAHVNELPPLLRELRPDVPKSVEAVVFKALAKRPEERYQQARQLAAQFAQATTGKMPPGLRVVPTPPAGMAGAVAKTAAPVQHASPSSPRPSGRPASSPALASEAPTQLGYQFSPSPSAGSAQAEPTRRPSRLMLVSIVVLVLATAVSAVLALSNNSGTSRETGAPRAVNGDASSGSAPTLPTDVDLTATPTAIVTATISRGGVVVSPTHTIATVASTSTATPTKTMTPTPTDTMTNTPTRTRTPTPTPTKTPTTTPTATPTATRPSATATPTQLPTNTPTLTPTNLPTPVPTSPPTAVPTNPPTPTPVLTNTPLPDDPTNTPIP